MPTARCGEKLSRGTFCDSHGSAEELIILLSIVYKSRKVKLITGGGRKLTLMQTNGC